MLLCNLNFSVTSNYNLLLLLACPLCFSYAKNDKRVHGNQENLVINTIIIIIVTVVVVFNKVQQFKNLKAAWYNCV